MAERKPRRPLNDPEKGDVSFDLGFGGLFKGLGNFLDLISEMAETGQEEVKRSGEFKVKGMGDKVKGVYGFSVRTGVGGIPRVEHFGNVKSTDQGPIVTEVREPMVDVFDEDGEIVVVAELPGVSEGEIKVEVQEDILTLQTTGERKYGKDILLPAKVVAASLQKTYKNGILELRVKKA